MATVVPKTIGTTGSRDYTSPANWEAAIPADISAATGTDEIWVGTCMVDEEYTASGTQLAIASRTVDDPAHGTYGKFRIVFTADDAVTHDTTYTGARLNASGDYQNTVEVNCHRVKIEKVALKTQRRGSILNASSNDAVYDRVYFELGYTFYAASAIRVPVGTSGGAAPVFSNCLIAQTSGGASCSGTTFADDRYNDLVCENVTAIDLVGRAFVGHSSTPSRALYNNCAAFNCLRWGDTAKSYGGDYNASDESSVTTIYGTTNSTASLTSSDFEDYAGGDYTPASGGLLEDAGTTPTEAGDVDILGTSRPQNSVWDIGAFERINAGGGATVEIGVYSALISGNSLSIEDLIPVATYSALTTGVDVSVLEEVVISTHGWIHSGNNVSVEERVNILVQSYLHSGQGLTVQDTDIVEVNPQEYHTTEQEFIVTGGTTLSILVQQWNVLGLNLLDARRLFRLLGAYRGIIRPGTVRYMVGRTERD